MVHVGTTRELRPAIVEPLTGCHARVQLRFQLVSVFSDLWPYNHGCDWSIRNGAGLNGSVYSVDAVEWTCVKYYLVVEYF